MPQLDHLIDFWTRLLVRLGFAESRARATATVQIEIEAFGVTTHGIRLLCHTVDLVVQQRIQPDRELRVLRECGGVQVLDGIGMAGVAACSEAVQRVHHAATQHGIGFLSLRTGWTGALGYHLAAPARDGCFLYAWAQTPHPLTVAVHGGSEPRLATNPIAFAAPTGGDPLIADFSTSIISNGQMGKLKREGRQAPEPIFLGPDGELSADPAVNTSERRCMLPLGGVHYGFKGSAMSVWIELLTAAAGGDAANPEAPGAQSLHLLCLTRDALGGRADYEAECARFLEFITGGPVREGAQPFRIPGERGWAALQRARQEGLALQPEFAAKMEEWAQTYELPLAL